MALNQIVVAEHETGASMESIAGTFELSQEAAREHLSAQFQRDPHPGPRPLPDEGTTELQVPSCCHDPICPRAEITLLLTPDQPMEQRVDALASATARSCSGLNDDQLRSCFSHSFELASECRYFDRFSRVYKAEQVALKGAEPSAIRAGLTSNA